MNQIVENGVMLQIHKGTNEIGGSCIELSTKNTTILLDYGTPLKEHSTQAVITKPIDAILISHPHQDHFGEIVNIEVDIPVYCGELSRQLMNATKIFTGEELLKNNFQTFEAWQTFEIGDFTIKPYLVDHSATDAYAFLIEVCEKKILYSGDFRASGRKSKLFDNMIKNDYLKEVDILLMEGTMLQRSNNDFPDEQSVEEKIYETLRVNEQISFMISASQNIDSLVSAYKACKRAGKVFVIDIYTAWILEKVKKVAKVMNLDFDNVKVYKPTVNTGGNQYGKVTKSKDFFDTFKDKIFHKDNLITFEEIKLKPSKYFVKCSPWYIENILKEIDAHSASIIYSQWKGYQEEKYSDKRTAKLYQKLRDNYHWVYAHTSGHANLPTLQKFASSLKPKQLIPIHTEFKHKFIQYFDNVIELDDNEKFKFGA